jgi:hypothetical protein
MLPSKINTPSSFETKKPAHDTSPRSETEENGKLSRKNSSESPPTSTHLHTTIQPRGYQANKPRWQTLTAIYRTKQTEISHWRKLNTAPLLFFSAMKDFTICRQQNSHCHRIPIWTRTRPILRLLFLGRFSQTQTRNLR